MSMTRAPFSLFEEYMLLDDTPSFPMDPVVALTFKGELKSEPARAALEDALKRHFLITSRAVRRCGKFYWVPDGAPPEIIRIDADSEPDALNSVGFPKMAPIDLYAGPAMRLYLVKSASQNALVVFIQFHHSIADGLGISRVIEEFLINYGKRTGAISEDVEPRPLDAAAFKYRGNIGWSFKSYLKNYLHTRQTTKMHTLVYPRPLVFVPHFGKVPPETDGPFVVSTTLSREETKRYLLRAKSASATVNDMLLADYFLAMERWLRETRQDFKPGVLRVMVPIDMRTPGAPETACSNVVSTVFVDRKREALDATREDILKSVSEEMKRVKEQDQKYVFLLILRILRLFPGSLRFFLRLPTCRSSSVLSNLGRFFDAIPLPRDVDGKIKIGDLKLEKIESKAPIRRKTSTSCVALTYAGEININLCYDSRVITEEEARSFNRTFKEVMLDDSPSDGQPEK